MLDYPQSPVLSFTPACPVQGLRQAGVNGNPGKEIIKRSGFLLEFIPAKTGAGMTINKEKSK